MTRLVVVAGASVLLILFLTFVLGRLIRSRRRGLSIRMQFFLALAGIVGTFAFGLGVLVVDRVEARAVRLAEAATREEALALSALLTAELERTNANLGVIAAELERALDRFPSAETQAARGVPLSFRERRGEPAGFELIDEQGRKLYPTTRDSLSLAPGSVSFSVPLSARGERVGQLRVVKPTIVVQAMLADFAPTVLVLSLVLGAAAALSAAWIGATIAEPIEALSLFAEQVSEGRRARLPVRVSGRELSRLVRSIDIMQRKLEGRPFVETFAADLSHELKNPVAAIYASSEVLLDGALEDPVHAKRFVARIHEAAGRIERLLAELLDLAHVESRGVAERAPIAVGKLCEEVVSALDTEARLVHLDVEAGARWRGDPLWLGRAVRNLVDNALTHSPPDTDVHVRVRTVEEGVELLVENVGHIPENLRASLFQRFMTTRRNEGGTGLGLSIASAVAEAHSGSVEFRAFGPEVRVALVLPRA